MPFNFQTTASNADQRPCLSKTSSFSGWHHLISHRPSWAGGGERTRSGEAGRSIWVSFSRRSSKQKKKVLKSCCSEAAAMVCGRVGGSLRSLRNKLLLTVCHEDPTCFENELNPNETLEHLVLLSFQTWTMWRTKMSRDNNVSHKHVCRFLSPNQTARNISS